VLAGLDQRRFRHQRLHNVLDVVLIATEDAAQDAQVRVVGGIWLVALHLGQLQRQDDDVEYVVHVLLVILRMVDEVAVQHLRQAHALVAQVLHLVLFEILRLVDQHNGQILELVLQLQVAEQRAL